MKKILSCYLFFFLLVSSLLQADGQAVLQKFLQRNSKISSFKAEFTQKNYWPKQEIVNTSQGVLYTRGENILLEHKEPEHQYMVGTEDELVFYFPKRKKLLGSDASFWQYFLSPQFLTEEYLHFCQYQSYQPQAEVTTFTFKAKKAIDDLKQIKITFSNQDSLIHRFFYKDRYNNEVLFDFREQQVNIAIPDSIFHLEIPTDVEVIDQRKQMGQGNR